MKKPYHQHIGVFWLSLLLCLFSNLATAQDSGTISGHITNELGEPLAGVTVQNKNNNAHAISTSEGQYSIKAGMGNALTFSFIGYQSVTKLPQSTRLDIQLVPADTTTAGTEVIVTAMGIKKEARSLGYAVATVGSKDLTESGATNFASALYGKAAGVKVAAAPGGASSAVNIQIRGVSSIGLNTQPLYVVDGVPIRLYNDLKGNLGNNSNNNGYWSNQRIQGNGVLDINPEDIESLTVLKGASASALYGSEATNGVVVITTKKGKKGKGLGVDFNYTYNQEKVASSPDYQNEYGPGDGPIMGPLYNGSDEDGWMKDDDGSIHPYYDTYSQFGPKFDGRSVRYWDGTTRPYNANPDNYKDFFQTGYNSNANIAVSNASEAGSYRFSYTRMDYKGIMPGSELNKNNFNLNATLQLTKDISLDVVSSYNSNYTHNRPYLMSQLFGSFDGMFSRFDDMQTYKNKYKTTNGYKYVPYNQDLYDVDQRLAYPINAINLMDYFWTNLRNSYDESQNRFINSVTLNVTFSDHFKFRGRVGGDFTHLSITDKQYNTQPAALGATGLYGVQSNTFNIFYGDALLTYNNNIGDFGYSVTAGATGRKMVNRMQNSSTDIGLVNENFFSLNNSAGTLRTTATRAEQVDIAEFQTLNLNYKDWLYLEGTGRYEATSTLPANANSYFYPSVNAGFIFSEIMNLPDFVDYAKLRASYGLVGNHPNIYQANVAYNQTGLDYGDGKVLYQGTKANNFGNEGIQSEKKRETEFGFEAHMFNNRLGMDLSYYNNRVNNQILVVNTAGSIGATSMLMNAGDLSNQGFEAALNGTPVAGKNFTWTTRFNLALNKNKLTRLPDGLPYLDLSSLDGGYVIIRARAGEALGNIYVHPIATNDKGEKIVDDNGTYAINTDEYQYAGNIMPKVVGGFSNSIKYKQFALDFTIDYRFGGNLISVPTYYQTGAGMYESTLKYRDEAHGGLSYNIVNGEPVLADNGSHHDGLILEGVRSDGSANDQLIDASTYYNYTYNWENNGNYGNAVFKNSYIKFREVTFSYNLPHRFAEKIHFQRLQLSLIGRNLFYIWKTLPNGLDPEVAVGSSWLSQGIDGGTAPPTRSIGISLRAAF